MGILNFNFVSFTLSLAVELLPARTKALEGKKEAKSMKFYQFSRSKAFKSGP